MEKATEQARVYMRDVSDEWTPDQFESIYEAFKEGWHQAHGIACHNVPKIGDKIPREVDWIGHDVVDADNVRDVHEMYCLHAEEHGRCFSPFEYIAHDFNTTGDVWLTEALWDAYEAGVSASIAHDVSTYTLEDYGLENEQC